MTICQQIAEAECGHVEVFTTSKDGTAFGYRLFGAAAGPQLVVAGMCEDAEHVFDRLLRIPTLPWMRGTLVLIRLDALDDMLGELNDLPTLGVIDRTLVLPWSTIAQGKPETIKRSYHLVLRTCANLGMISGRGVSSQVSLEEVP